MFRKLHIHLTLFCTFVTGVIFLSLTFICLLFAGKSLKETSYSSFMSQLNSALIHLQEQEFVSHQWLNQLLEKGQLTLYLYDNGNPLFYQDYHTSAEEQKQIQEAEKIAQDKLGMDLFSKQANELTVHEEYDFISSSGKSFYASAGIIPKKEGFLSFILLSPLEDYSSRIGHLRLIICMTDLIAIVALFLFFRYFTKRMIIPLEKSQEKQNQFIASASHELRSPLSVLHSGMEVLRETNDPDRQAHVLDLMQKEGTRMQHLIRDMLLLAHSDSDRLSLHLTPCQPDELLLSLYENFEALAAKQMISLTLHLPDELIRDFCCDRERITQVFSILMNNALSYTPSGGTIHLSLSLRRISVLFRFSDTGCGIPDHEKTLIFDRFYRSDRAHTDKEHFGLGLCIAKELISAHSGKIWVEDSPEGGSCFCVELPRTNYSSSCELCSKKTFL